MTVNDCLCTNFVFHRLLSHSLLLTTAATCHSLRHLVPNIKDLLKVTVAAVKPWASPDSSAEIVYLILQTLRHKITFRSASPEPQAYNM